MSRMLRFVAKQCPKYLGCRQILIRKVATIVDSEKFEPEIVEVFPSSVWGDGPFDESNKKTKRSKTRTTVHNEHSEKEAMIVHNDKKSRYEISESESEISKQLDESNTVLAKPFKIMSRNFDSFTFVKRLQEEMSNPATNFPQLKMRLINRLTIAWCDVVGSDGQTAGQLIKIMGQLGFKIKHFDNRPVLKRLAKSISKIHQISPRQLNQVLLGFSTCGMTWQDIVFEQRRDYFKMIEKVMLYETAGVLQITCMEFTNILHAMKKLDLKWNMLPRSTMEAILNAFIHNTTHFNVKNGGPLCINLFGKLGFQMNITNAFFVRDLNRVIDYLLHDLETHAEEQRLGVDLSAILTGLTKMNAQYDTHLSESLQNTLKNVVIGKHLVKMRNKELGLVLLSFGRLRMPWSSLTPESQSVIQVTLGCLLAEMEEGALMNSLMCLYNMDARWSDLMPPLQEEIVHTVLELLPKMNQLEVASVFLSLSKLHVNWSTNTTFRTSLFHLLEVKVSKMDGISLQNICNALGLMNVVFARDLSSELQSELVALMGREIGGMDANTLARSVRNFGYVSLPWTSLTPVASEVLQYSLSSLLHSMNPDQISYVMEGLANMKCDFEALSPDLLHALQDVLVNKLSNRPDNRAASVVENLSKLDYAYK